MRTLLMVFMLAGMMSTVGVYAAGLGGTPSIKKLGGTGSQTVNSPTSAAVSLDWTFTGATVTGVDVTWTPDTATTYDITVVAGGTTGTLTTPTTGVISRTDSVTMASTAPDAITTAEVVIKEN